jgi:hypothetical protein
MSQRNGYGADGTQEPLFPQDLHIVRGWKVQNRVRAGQSRQMAAFRQSKSGTHETVKAKSDRTTEQACASVVVSRLLYHWKQG